MKTVNVHSKNMFCPTFLWTVLFILLVFIGFYIGFHHWEGIFQLIRFINRLF